MELNDYQQQAVKTAIYGSGSRIIYPSIGLFGEAGEVANKVAKVIRDKEGIFSAEDREAIIKEIGDVLWFCAALTNDLGFSMEDVAQANLDKLRDRHERGVIQGSGDNR